MADLINKIQCGDEISNTGGCACFFDPKNPIGMIFAPKSFKITEANILLMQSYLEGKTRAPKSLRIYPIQNFVSLTDGTEDPTVESFAFGQKETVREGNYSWTFAFRKGGVTLSNKLRTFNGKENSFNVLFFDAQNSIYGCSVLETNGTTSITGIPLSRIYTSPWKVNDGTKNAGYMINVEFLPVYLNEKLAFAKLDSTNYLLKELTGLQDILLKTSVPLSAPGAVTVSVNTDCGDNLYDTYAALLVNSGIWTAKNKATGLDIPITSVVVNDGLKAFIITLSTASPNYPATSGGLIDLSLVSAESLATANIVGFESNILTISKP